MKNENESPGILASAAPRPGRQASWRALPGRALAIPEVGVLIPLIALTILFAILSPNFLNKNSILTMLVSREFLGIAAIGETVLLIAGELDLSVGSVAGMSGIVAASLMGHGWPIPLALAAGVALGALAGLINGMIAVGVGVPAFIATLGMLWMARGVNYLISNGLQIEIPHSLVRFGAADPLGLSWPFWIFISAAIIVDLTLRFTTVGRRIFATGGNVEVARVAGINTGKVKISCYVFTGALAAIAGILQACTSRLATAEAGTDWELQVIAAVVVGGVSLFGGTGSVIAAVFGLLVMQVVETGLQMQSVHGVSSHWQKIAVGAIMIASVAFDVTRRRAKSS